MANAASELVRARTGGGDGKEVAEDMVRASVGGADGAAVREAGGGGGPGAEAPDDGGGGAAGAGVAAALIELLEPDEDFKRVPPLSASACSRVGGSLARSASLASRSLA